MLLPTTLVLALVQCIVAKQSYSHNSAIVKPLDEPGINFIGDETFSGIDKLDKNRMYEDTYLKIKRLQKRTFSSFQLAWKAILQRTLGSVKIIEGQYNRKLFIKIGSLDNAVDDFYSLGPSRIKQNDSKRVLSGLTGNQVIVLRTAADQPPVLYVANGKTAKQIFDDVTNTSKVERAMVYVDNLEEAKAFLQSWRKHQ